MPAKHPRNGRTSRQPFGHGNALLLHSQTSDVDELTVPYSVTPESASNDSPAPTLSTLSNFDPALPTQGRTNFDVVDPEENLMSMARSPPFIQAPLSPIDDIIAKDTAPRSPQPLPTRPRISVTDSMADSSLVGHTRSPILAREQSTFESFSRTLRTYVPSSIHIPVPRSAPSPPLVSMPVSFGSFSGPPQILSADHLQQGRHGHEEETVLRPAERHGRGSGNVTSGLARALQHREGDLNAPALGQRGLSYPGLDRGHSDPILWARWDKVHDRRVLILAYTTGFQLWDCTNLGSITEVLNVCTASSDWLGGGEVVGVFVLPPPSSHVVQRFGDPYAEDRPLLGIIMNLDFHQDFSTLFIYSLSRQHIIKHVPLSGLSVTAKVNPNFLVIAVTNPAALQIYSPTTFKEIYTIHSNSLAPFSHSPVSYSNLASKLFTTGPSNNNKGNYDAVFLGEELNTTDDSSRGSSSPRPIFALSNHLLAYSSSAPFFQQAQQSPSRGSGHSACTSPSASPFGVNLPTTQAELGTAAIKVGGTFLNGMKALGGIALSAAKNHIMTDGNSDISVSPGWQQGQSYHRKYAMGVPIGSVDSVPNRERRHSTASMGSQDSTGGRSYFGSEQAHTSPILPNASMRAAEQGSYVTIVDLGSLLAGDEAPRRIGEFLTSRSQPVAGLSFSSDGCSIIVVPMSGQVVQVYRIQPTPGVLRQIVASGEAGSAGSNVSGGGNAADYGKRSREMRQGADAVTRTYHLHRGQSQAIVDDVVWADDGRWVAIGTLRPTIHVFAVNPYGGKPDLKSHTKGKVFNINERQPLSVEIGPLVRLRALKAATSAPSGPKMGLSFTFIEPSEGCLPSSLLPTLPSGAGLGDKVGSSAHHHPRPSNYQDLLVFDPNDGLLSLRHITTEAKARDQGHGLSAAAVAAAVSVSKGAAALGATSISLPGLGGAGKLSGFSLSSSPSPSPSVAHPQSASSSASGKQGHRGANVNLDVNVTHELVGKESVVATWNLQRRRDWEEVKQQIVLEDRPMRTTTGSKKAIAQRYLAQAELSTFSRSPGILPRSIYLSHQFSFYTLGEDYHALIRRPQLDITGSKIEVRKEVQVSAFPSSDHDISEVFMEGFPSGSTSQDSRRHSASFDEPLANALAGGLEYDASMASAVLPMYPNGGVAGSGSGGSRPIIRASFRKTIPIRTIGDGMSESLGRLRREINKVRSPRLLPYVDGGGGSSGGASPGIVPLEFDEEDEDFLIREHKDGGNGGADDVDASSGWDSQDREAVEDEERFHDLIGPGLMEEEGRGALAVVLDKHPVPSPSSSPNLLKRQSLISMKRLSSTPVSPTSTASTASPTSPTPVPTPRIPTPPEGPPAIITIPPLSPSASSSASAHSSQSSSPSTTAFATPASSLASANPSTPPSPSMAPSSTLPLSSSSSSTLPGYAVAISTAISGTVGTRPAPPSPALSRRQSTKSSIMAAKSSSRPGSVGVLAHPLVAVLSAEPVAELSNSKPRQLIKIRDYGFQPADDRFHGLGPFVPRWNRLERLNRALLSSGKGGDGGKEKKERRKRKKKKKKAVNGWSDSEEDSADSRESGRSGGSDSDSGLSERGSDESGSESEDGSAPHNHHHQREEDTFWGGFKLGRLSWHQALGHGGVTFDSSTEKERGEERSVGFPTQRDLDRNFGQGCDPDDQSQSPSSSEPYYPYDNEHYQAGGTDDYYQGYQDKYQDFQDYQEELPPSGPLLPGFYRALYAFEPEGACEMGLDEDQVVRVVGRGGGDGWAVVIDEREGKKGGHALVPESYLEVVSLDDAPDGDHV